jgi:histidinol-phosphate aminotransferase
MSNWRDNLTKLVAYKAGSQLDDSNVIKLNANENPYPPSPEVNKALGDFGYENLKKYPVLNNSPLDQAIAEYYNVDKENVFSGNSSDEVLAMCFRAFFNSSKPILFPDITYSFYPVWCDFYRLDYNIIPVSNSLNINVDDYIGKDNGGIIICNPNAPTGIALELNEIEKLIVENQSSIIIIDEAYADFGDETAVGLTKKYDNILITGTLSKSRSLAGLRVGYAVSSKVLIEALRTAMNSFNAYPISSLSIKLAEASMRDKVYFSKITRKIKDTREYVYESLQVMGFQVTDSKANFLFITHEKVNAESLYEYLLSKKILVRFFNKERIDNYLRVSIGTDDEMKVFLEEVKNYLEDSDSL